MATGIIIPLADVAWRVRDVTATSADTLIVENRLRNTSPGDVVTYAELSTLLGRDVRQFCAASIATAKKALISESIFFDTVIGTGFKRLDDEEACKASSHYIDRSRRNARRGLRHLAHIQVKALSEEGRTRHLTVSAQLGTVAMFMSGTAARRIEEKVRGASHQLAIGETLRLFGGETNEEEK